MHIVGKIMTSDCQFWAKKQEKLTIPWRCGRRRGEATWRQGEVAGRGGRGASATTSKVRSAYRECPGMPQACTADAQCAPTIDHQEKSQNSHKMHAFVKQISHNSRKMLDKSVEFIDKACFRELPISPGKVSRQFDHTETALAWRGLSQPCRAIPQYINCAQPSHLHCFSPHDINA